MSLIVGATNSPTMERVELAATSTLARESETNSGLRNECARFLPMAFFPVATSPPENDDTFLISNAIGFLGVLQHTVNYDGADITATEIEPIVYSDDPNFRPSDMEVGGDGALYIADWHNALIGHMQHNMRDPNRDHSHGRIYRVTYEGRPLLTPPKMKGKPIAEVCQNFLLHENGTRYTPHAWN